jgi:hypothetical protein
VGALSFLQALPVRAAGEVVVDEGGTVVDMGVIGGGMSSSNPRVGPILAAHPGQYVVICVAGCNGKPRVVQLLPRPMTVRVGELVPSKAKTGPEVYGPSRPEARAGKAEAKTNDVVCVAGCTGRVGQVLQRMSGLPPEKTKAPQKTGDKERRIEPLDTNP